VGGSSSNSQKFRIFGINLPQRGYIPLNDFYKIWRGGGKAVPGHAKFKHCGFKKFGL